MHLILASASPQRRTLLDGLGVSFDVVPSDVDEAACSVKNPVERARMLACLKARDVAAKHPNTFVLGCDTLVVASDGTLLEKPADANEARRMITMQSGKTSLVHSGLCLIDSKGEEHVDVSSSSVTFAALGDAEIDAWIASDLWRDRSGGFQIDGRGQFLIAHIEGDWTGVVGLSVFLLGKLFGETGFSLQKPKKQKTKK